MDKLVLFDIDKTLIKSAKEHHNAFSVAFKNVFGLDVDIDIIEHAGMTDWQIITEVLKQKGVAEEEIKSKISQCMEEIVKYFKEAVKDAKVEILPGVKNLLPKLKKNNVLIGLVTGNLEQVARAKLAKIGLDDYFKVGGFGSDDIDRTNLVKIAVKKAQEEFNFKGDIFLVGDAPRDMYAGKAAGVKNIGVATGKFSIDELRSAGADFAIPNLENTEEILAIIFK